MAHVQKLLSHLTSVRERVEEATLILSDLQRFSPVARQLSQIVKDIAVVEIEYGLNPKSNEDIAVDTSTITETDFGKLLDEVTGNELSDKDREMLKSKPHIVHSVQCCIPF